MSDPFTLQLHITDACQLRCTHCYRDARRADLPLDQLARIIGEFTAFCATHDIDGRLTFAGGEPTLRWADLTVLTKQAAGAGLQVHLLTNGLLLTAERIAELKAAGCLRAQVSLDGDEAAHDALRGAGAFRKAEAALAALRRGRMHATVSMTVGRWNLSSLEPVLAVAQKHEARVFVSRFVPCGSGRTLGDELLSHEEWARVMKRCRTMARGHSPGVSLRDPTYASCDGCAESSTGVDGCAIGYMGLAVDSDGTAYPCRRLPIPLGNLTSDSLEKIWESPQLERLRDRDALGGRCGECAFRWKCGGCRAIAYGLVGDMLAEDPQCPGHLAQTPGRRFLQRCSPRRLALALCGRGK